MVYNGHTQNLDIVSAINGHTGAHKIADIGPITLAANEADRLIWSWILEVSGGWQYDDGNQTDLPSAKAHLVAGQNKYSIPEETLVVRKVSYKDEQGSWGDLDPITSEDIGMRSAESEFYNTPGQPKFYRLRANVIELYPAPNFSQVRSLRMHIDRGSVGFGTDDTTKSPGYASEFHSATAVGAGYFMAADRGLRNLVALRDRWVGYETSIKAYYKARFKELNPTQKKTHRPDPLAQLS